jgi:hypothetical protein
MSNKSKGMLYKSCKCGHRIGVEHTDNPTTFYDEYDWEKPITVCPSCNEPITAENLQLSEKQRQALVKVKVDPIVKTRRMKFKVRFTPCSFNISCNPLEFVNVRSLLFVR